MDKFSRRNGAGGTTATTAEPGTAHGNSTSHTQRRGLFSSDKEARNHHRDDTGYLNRRPTFGQWLKVTWLDILTMVILGVIGLGVYEAHPAPTRSFPINFVDGVIFAPHQLAFSANYAPGDRVSSIRLPPSQRDCSNLARSSARRPGPHILLPSHADPHPLVLGRQ